MPLSSLRRKKKKQSSFLFELLVRHNGENHLGGVSFSLEKGKLKLMIQKGGKKMKKEGETH